MSTPLEAGTRERVFAPGRRSLTFGLVLTITLVGFEALAVSTALPAIANDLHGLEWYGLVFTTYMLGNLLGITAAGQRADSHGPAQPFAAGLALFALGLIAAGAAPSMPVLVAARFIQGFGGGAIPAMAYVCVGRGYPARLQPRVFAIMSTAWVVPGMIGPAISAWITSQLGWRWVFFGLLPVIIPAAAMALPALRALAPEVTSPGHDEEGRRRLRASIRLAFGVALVFGTGPLGNAILTAPLIVIGAVIAARAYTELVPAGTVRLIRGLPATIGLRAFQTFAFFGVDAFIPYAFHDVRGTSLGTASIAVTAATLSWTAGAWLQARLSDRMGPRLLVQAGLLVIAAGNLIAGLVVFEWWPIPLAIAGDGIAGFGMGLGYSAVSVTMLAFAPPGREGAVSSSLSLTDVLGIAVATGIAGAWIGLAVTLGWSARAGVLGILVLPVLAGLAGAVASQRLPKAIPAATSASR